MFSSQSKVAKCGCQGRLLTGMCICNILFKTITRASPLTGSPPMLYVPQKGELAPKTKPKLTCSACTAPICFSVVMLLFWWMNFAIVITYCVFARATALRFVHREQMLLCVLGRPRWEPCHIRLEQQQETQEKPGRHKDSMPGCHPICGESDASAHSATLLVLTTYFYKLKS